MKQFNFKFLVVMLLCLLQASGVCAQKFLNQHDENGKKHGQWVDTEIDGDGKEHVTGIEMYNHGKKQGIEYGWSSSYPYYPTLLREYDENGDLMRDVCFREGKIYFEFFDFEKIDTLIFTKCCGAKRLVLKCKSRVYHPNGVIKEESVNYCGKDGNPVVYSRIFERRFYTENGYLSEIRYFNADEQRTEVRHFKENGLAYIIKYSYDEERNRPDVWYDRNGNEMQVSEEPIFRETEYGQKIKTGTRWKNEKGETIREE